MRILAIESSGREASMAVLEAKQDSPETMGEVALGGRQRTAQALAPAMKKLIDGVNWPADSIELVAVTIGPGSFTGLRIGVTAAKTFAYAIGASVIGVNSLTVLARQVTGWHGELWVIMDAQRQELFAARFDILPNIPPQINGDVRIMPQSEWLSQLAGGQRVTGPALGQLQTRTPPGVQLTEPSLWQPQASTLGCIAYEEYKSGRRDDLWQLVPKYYRRSAAEERRSLP